MARPPLLFVHGALTGAWIWDTWREQLERLGWEAIVIDLRGHGRSLPADFTSVTIDDYLHDLESVVPQVAAARQQQPVVAGWGIGGLLAMLYAAAHQETPALVLLSPPPPLEVAGRASPELVRQVPPGPFGPEQDGLYPDDREASRAALFDLGDAEVDRALLNLKGAQESGFACRQVLRGISVAPGAIRCPALVLYGEEDACRPPEQNRRLAAYLGAEQIGVAGAGLWGIVCHEEAVIAAAAALDAWLRSHLEVGDA